jgi:hypothetical protein
MKPSTVACTQVHILKRLCMLRQSADMLLHSADMLLHSAQRPQHTTERPQHTTERPLATRSATITVNSSLLRNKDLYVVGADPQGEGVWIYLVELVEVG